MAAHSTSKQSHQQQQQPYQHIDYPKSRSTPLRGVAKKVTMFKLRQRNCLLLTTLLVIMPCIIVLLIMGPDLSTEQSLSQRLGACSMRLQYLESMYRARQEDVAILSHYLGLMQSTTTMLTTGVGGGAAGAGTNVSLSLLSAEVRQMLKNTSMAQQNVAYQQAPFTSTSPIRFPTMYHFLPHLLDDPTSLRPAYLQSKGRADVSIVLGIPTVKREKQSYLLSTLKNLIENMNDEEQNETLIVVYIGETDQDAVQFIARQIEETLESYIECGLIDIIAPSPAYYPNFDKLRNTLNDSLERVKWRSKQNLDFSYLMSYAQSKGTFYVQLEDDILSKRNFITSMKKYANTKSALTKPDQPPWLVLDFCQLGFIGKMFKSAELPYIITFLQMFYNDKPVDWLLTDLIESKVCRMDLDQKHCNQEKAKYWLHYRPSLFQHVGTSSSLKGKVQKLRDKQFGQKVPAYYGHANNPPALVKTNIAPYKNYLLKRAYRGETYFWGLQPQKGDLVEFVFEKSVPVRRYLFRSGNTEHPSDRFYNTSVEVQAISSTTALSYFNTTADGYVIVGDFNALGVAEGVLDERINRIKELRLHVHSDSDNWVLLSEIRLEMDGGAEGSVVEVIETTKMNKTVPVS